MARHSRMKVVARIRAAVESGDLGIMGQVIRPDGRIGEAAITFSVGESAAVIELLRLHSAVAATAKPPCNLQAGEVVPPARLPMGSAGTFATGWLSLPPAWLAGGRAVSGMADDGASHINLAVTY